MERLVSDGDPKQFADHSRREGMRNGGNEVHLAAIFNCVEKLLGECLDPWLQRRDPARRKCPRNEASQACVVGRVVARHTTAHILERGTVAVLRTSLFRSPESCATRGITQRPLNVDIAGQCPFARCMWALRGI